MSQNNFIKTAIENGFIPHPKDFTPNSNWFGVSKQNPCAMLTRGDQKIHISLNGFSMPFPYYNERIDEIKSLMREIGCKYLCFKEGETKLYETYFGELPSQDFLDGFIQQKTRR